MHCLTVGCQRTKLVADDVDVVSRLIVVGAASKQHESVSDMTALQGPSGLSRCVLLYRLVDDHRAGHGRVAHGVGAHGDELHAANGHASSGESRESSCVYMKHPAHQRGE